MPGITLEPISNGSDSKVAAVVTGKRDHSNPTFVLKTKGEFAYEDRSVPTLKTDKHVVVAIHSTGLCGSDVHYWKHGRIGDFEVTAPIVLGHESSGIVKECGSAVTSLKPGDRVALEPGVPCRFCEYCRGGRYNLCPDMKFAATPPYDGTLAAYFAIPEDFCYKLPEEVSLEEGALVEPLSVAVHCAKLGNITFGSTVFVMGAGPIGLLCCAVAKALGASKVATADIDVGRLEFARQYVGAMTYEMKNLDPRQNAAFAQESFQPWTGADVVIDATGVGSCISTGIHLLKAGGMFVQAGLGAENITFPVAQLCSKEGTYRGSFRYGASDYATAIEFLRQGRVSVKELITHRFAFSEAEEAFKSVANRSGIKAVISGPV